MLSWIYLAALLVSVLGQVLRDQRWHLFFWRDWRRAAGTLGLGLAFFIAWDLVGIHLGVFFKGHSPFVLGVNLAPEFPVEELVFLTLLIYVTMNLHGWFTRSERRSPAP